MLRRYQHVIAQLRREATRRVTELLYGPEPEAPKKKKSKKANKKKRRDQERLKIANVTAVTLGTSPGTSGQIAPVIPLFGRTKIS